MSNSWSLCYIATYDVSLGQSNLPSILATCNKEKLLLGCRPVGGVSLTLAAMGNRSDVLHDCGTDQSCVYSSNDVGWYYSGSYSWGFAKGGDPVNRISCDYQGINGEYRLCWHTLDYVGGYRCGSTEALNGGTNWEKLIYHAN